MFEVSNNAGGAGLPHHFAAFVEVFFAVVLGASILEPEIRTLLFPPAVTSLSFWALVVVYFTAITSWIGWHKSTIEFPYTDSRAGRVRSVLDAVVVLMYVALLFFGSRIDAFLTWYLWGFVIVFALYYSVGKLRRVEHHTPRASKPPLIVRHGVAMLVGAVACTVLTKILSQPPVALLWVFVLLPLPIMASRWFREWREVPWTARAKGKLTIAVDMDGVLVEQVAPVLQKLKKEADVDLNKYDITDWEYPFRGTNIKVEIERAEQDEQFVRDMPLMKDAREALEVLSKRFDIVIATSRDPLTDAWSRDWLSVHGIPYTRLINTHSEGKVLSGVDLLIDDYIGNIKQFIRNGSPDRQAILFAQPWNYDTGSINDLISSRKVSIAHSWQAVLSLLGCGLSRVELVKKLQTPQP
jgi:5'(3')-deoxyribonucleotidase